MPAAGWISHKRRSWPEGHRACTICKEIKPYSEFHRHSDPRFIGGVIPQCKLCRNVEAINSYNKTSIEYRLWYAAKSRATKKGLDFDIEVTDIKIPRLCPVFSVPLKYNSENAPSIDRIDNEKGYIKGNIRVISKRANRIKGDASFEELLRVVEQWREIL